MINQAFKLFSIDVWNPEQQFSRYVILGIVTCFCVVVGIIPLKIAMTYHQVPQAQAMLVLGGNANREMFAAHLAKRHPNLPIWLSSGMEENEARQLFEQVTGSSQQLHFDRRAVDTVTNFTTLVEVFQQQRIRHLFLITSDYHMMRGKLIASIILGSHSIVTTAKPVPSSKPPESPLKILRDMLRAILWIFTGWSGAHVRSV